jgi:catechol 2,3-dioxygenase-like lactoylglutathione lyase family enzyme
VITVSDRQRSAEFYAEILGGRIGESAGGAIAITFGSGDAVDIFEPPAGTAFRLREFSFLIPDQDIGAVVGRLEARGVEYEVKPGAVCFEDPDGHRVELHTFARHAEVQA